jgi:hypothetical protein
MPIGRRTPRRFPSPPPNRGPGPALVAAVVLVGAWWTAGCRCGDEDDDDGVMGTTGTDSDGSTGTTGTDPTTEPVTTLQTEAVTTVQPTTDSDTETTGDPDLNCGDGVLAPGELCFGPAMRISTVPSAAIALGDFDDDGAVDIAAGHEGEIRIHRGDGTGGFAAPLLFATDSGVLGLAVGDFDGDGVDDLAYSDSGAATVNLLLGGSGDLIPATPIAVGAYPRGLVAADLDGDGSLDLAVTSEDAGELTILSGDGDGGLVIDQVLVPGLAPLHVLAADIDGAGLDLFVANFGGNTVSVFPRGADGYAEEWSLSAQAGPRGLAFADFDGDSLGDLVAAHQIGASVGLWLGDGNELLAPAFTSVGSSPRSIAAADFDADGHADAAVALDGANAFGILRGTPTGFASLRSFPALPRPDSIAVGLIDDDAVLDVVVASSASNGGVAVVLATP